MVPLKIYYKKSVRLLILFYQVRLSGSKVATVEEDTLWIHSAKPTKSAPIIIYLMIKSDTKQTQPSFYIQEHGLGACL